MKLRNLKPRGRSLASKAGSATHMKPAEHHLGAEYLKTSSCSLDRGQAPAMWNFRPCSRTLHTHTHRKGVKQNHNCGKNASMVQMHASTKGSEVPVKWPHESASCGYADESELNSSETKASINTPNCRVGV